MHLAQTGHLLTPFVDDAEGRSHDASYANEAKIQINRKRPPTDRGTSEHCHRSAAVPSRSSTNHAIPPNCSETRPLALVLRLGTAALRP